MLRKLLSNESLRFAIFFSILFFPPFLLWTRHDTAEEANRREERVKVDVAHTEAYNKKRPTQADYITLIKKRDTPKILLDTLHF